MKCWYCSSDVIWQNDFTYEDYGCEGDGIVSVLICSSEECNAEVEIYKDL